MQGRGQQLNIQSRREFTCHPRSLPSRHLPALPSGSLPLSNKHFKCKSQSRPGCCRLSAARGFFHRLNLNYLDSQPPAIRVSDETRGRRKLGIEIHAPVPSLILRWVNSLWVQDTPFSLVQSLGPSSPFPPHSTNFWTLRLWAGAIMTRRPIEL